MAATEEMQQLVLQPARSDTGQDVPQNGEDDVRSENDRVDTELMRLRLEWPWSARRLAAGITLGWSRVCRELRRLGRWNWAADLVDALSSNASLASTGHARSAPLRSAAFNLSCLRPENEAGGSERVALDLLDLLRRSWPNVDFEVMSPSPDVLARNDRAPDNVWAVLQHKVAARNFDLLFRPRMRIPPNVDPDLPIATVLHDLQHHVYPQFFTSEEHTPRDHTIHRACRLSDNIVCPSEFVRSTTIEAGLAHPD